MFEDPIDGELDDLLYRYHKRFAGDERSNFGLMDLPATVRAGALKARLRTALLEDRPIDITAEFADFRTELSGGIVY